MRSGCVLALVAALVSCTHAAEQEFPYTAYVARPEAVARSGAGRNFYATDKLAVGDIVEVYRHDDDWCAIRPPPGSYSWVKAEDLQIGRDGLGLVLAEGSASRIGSNLSDLRDVIQVRLERGEQVEVLDAVQISNDNGIEFFCKISPPSGEFRWVHHDDLSRERPQIDPTGEAADSDTGARTRDTRESDTDTRRAGSSDRWGSWVRSRRGQQAEQAVHADADPPRRFASAGRTVGAISESDSPSPSNGGRAGSSARHRDVEQDPIRSINRELSQMLLQEPAQWSLDSVRQRIDEALRSTAAESRRTELRELQERVARFDDLHRRSIGVSMPEIDAARTAPEAATAATVAIDEKNAGASPAVSTTTNASPRTFPPSSDRYDGTGKLTRVVSKRPNAPRYALVNRDNEVVSFVTPAPGVNLSTYEGEYVGVYGQRGYMPELKKPHVTALRVHPLNSLDARLARRR
jgi:hypothetical protein